MEWTRQKLNYYLGNVRTTLEFQGLTEGEFTQAFENEAMRRLKIIQGIVFNEYATAEEKVEEIIAVLE